MMPHRLETSHFALFPISAHQLLACGDNLFLLQKKERGLDSILSLDIRFNLLKGGVRLLQILEETLRSVGFQPNLL